MSDVLNFDSVLTDEMINNAGGQEFITLPPGKYPFRVVKAEKSRFQPSELSKIKEVCPMMVVKIVCESADGLGSSMVTERLILHKAVLWRILRFFDSIGLHKPGERNCVLPWNDIVGKSGFVKLSTREYNGKTFNQVDSWEVNEEPITGDY